MRVKIGRMITTNMPLPICSLFFASWLCFVQPPVINQQVYDKKAIATAYNLTATQTDGEPCIGAGNHNLCVIQQEEPCKCVVATRLYSLHTKLFIEGFGECEVLDRTAKKYGSRIDILMPTYEEAIEFGKREVRYRVVN